MRAPPGAAYICQAQGRVNALRDAAQARPSRLLNGIQYLEVLPGQRRLEVHFVHPLHLVPAIPLTAANVEIRGGVRVRDPQVTGIAWQDDVLWVDVATAGDFSRYTLRLVRGADTSEPPRDIDPALAQVEFGFKVDCPSDLDCRTEADCPPAAATPPVIDYLARDYASLRRLLLDRLSVLLPGRAVRDPADMWVTVAEALAFRGDELSYFQDAVATEAYLGTARQRISVRRHTRLLDYAFHDGCNARAWVSFTASADGVELQACDPATGVGGTLMLTRVPGQSIRIDKDDVPVALAAGAQAFELLHPITVYVAHNRMHFYTWSDDECCLPKGATRAFLRDDLAVRLRLRVGDVLIFESRVSETTGIEADRDPHQRHALRLTRVEPEAPLDGNARVVPPLRVDPVSGQGFVEVEWADDDALPFSLCLSKRIRGRLVTDMAVICGNVALADHGFSAPRGDPLTKLPGGRVPRFPIQQTAGAALTQQSRVRKARSEELLLVDAQASASAAFSGGLLDARPAIDLRSKGDVSRWTRRSELPDLRAVTAVEAVAAIEAIQALGGQRWTVQRDLLASGPQASDFAVETENDGQAVLRFGDGINGRTPSAAEDLLARVRLGNGVAGNVGAESIVHVAAPGVSAVRNPLPARGGIDAQAPSQARLYAPQAFRRQERAVTAADYAEVVQRHARVQRAVATRRWTGSWATLFISIDPVGSETLDLALRTDLLQFIERYRLAGHDVELDPPSFVALDIELHVCARKGYFAADVEGRLLRAFSSRRLASGQTGFFHPDRYTFAQPVYLSALIAEAMRVPGVSHVSPTRFQRLGRNAAGEIDAGRIAIARLEIARLDNDPNAPENGRIRFDVEETI